MGLHRGFKMNTLNKMIVLMLIMNIFSYISVNLVASLDSHYMNEDLKFHFKGDLIETLLSNQTSADVSLTEMAEYTRDNWTYYNLEFDESVVSVPNKQTGEAVGNGGVNFLDALNIAYSFIPTLFNIAISPLTIFFNFRMPVIIGLIYGIPYFAIIIFSIFAFIRGTGD